MASASEPSLAKPQDQRGCCAGMLEPIVKFEDKFVMSYNTQELSTFRSFFLVSGTVFADMTLWWNQVCIVLLVSCVVLGCSVFRRDGFDQWVVGTEGKTRSFVQAMQTLVAFLLSFYVSLTVSRWWATRTGGVGKVNNATRELMFFLASFVTRDEEVLSAVRRYSSASILLFYCERAEVEDKWAAVQKACTLTDDEVARLKELGDPSMGCWAWITEIVAVLDRKGVIKSESHCQLLMECCAMGSQGIAGIKTHITQQPPLTYVHLLTLLVKLHNFFMSMVMGILISHYMKTDLAICITAFLRVYITTFMFNAVLCIGYQLADPFSGDSCDFNVPKMAKGLMSKGASMVEASRTLPAALQDQVLKAAANV